MIRAVLALALALCGCALEPAEYTIVVVNGSADDLVVELAQDGDRPAQTFVDQPCSAHAESISVGRLWRLRSVDGHVYFDSRSAQPIGANKRVEVRLLPDGSTSVSTADIAIVGRDAPIQFDCADPPQHA